jgi:hypothetical protein
MEMPPEKSEMMAFLGQDPLRYKIVVDNKCLQQLKNFKCLSCKASYENEKDVQQKIPKFAPILGIVSNTFRTNLVQKFSRKRVYNAQAVPIRLYGSEIWTLRKKKDKKLFTSIKMKFFRTPFLTTKGMKKFWMS